MTAKILVNAKHALLNAFHISCIEITEEVSQRGTDVDIFKNNYWYCINQVELEDIKTYSAYH